MLLRYVQYFNHSYIYKEFKRYEAYFFAEFSFGYKLDDDMKSVMDDLQIKLPSKLPEWLPRDSINPLVNIDE